MINLQYIPTISSFKMLINSTHVSFDECVLYEKRNFLNRCPIAGANGVIKLTVPLVNGRSQRKPLRDVLIMNEEKWQRRHWRSILSSYNSSPWFFHFTDRMSELYSRRFDFLIDWNLECLNWLYHSLRLQTNYSVVSGVTAHEAMQPPSKPTLYEPIVYRQVYQEKTGFIPHLSIIDLLFCTGPSHTMLLCR